MGFNDPRGSMWRKWDLHIHTPGTKLNDKFSSWEEFLSTIEKSDLSVIGVTDYFSIDNYKKVIEFKEKGRLKNVDLILPNIEFRLSEENKEGEFINIHIIFSPYIDIDRIENFLNRLPLFNKISNINLFCSRDDLIRVGYDKAIVSLENLIEHLEDNFTKDEFLLAAPCRGYGSFRPGSEGRKGQLAIAIDKIIDLVFGNELDREFFLREDRYPSLDKPLPKKGVFNCSDAHTEDEIGKKYTWVKADPTFNGFLHAIRNPQERVFIGERPPLLKRLEESPSKFIKKLAIKAVGNYDYSKGEWFKEVQIPFNPGMVAIIGHKGNGKSALADIIALCGNSHIKESHFSFLNEKRFKKPPDNIAQFFEARIYWWDDDESQSEGFILLSETSDKALTERVKYIPQHYFEVLTADLEGQEEFEKEIKNMIFQHIPEEEKYGREGFDQLEGFLSKTYIEEIEPIKREIGRLNEQIVSLELKKLPEYIKHIKEKKRAIQREINNLNRILEDKKKQMQELRSFLENSESKLSQINELEEERNELDEEIRNLKDEKAKILKRIEEIKYIKRWLINLKSNILKEIQEKREIFKEHGIDPEEIIKIEIKDGLIESIENEYNKRRSKIEDDLSDRENKLKNIIKQEKELKQNLEEKEKEYQSVKISIREIEEKIKELIGDVTRSYSLKWLEQEIEFVEKNKLENELRSLEEQRRDLALEIFKKLRHRIDVYERLKRNVDEVLGKYVDKLDSMGYRFSIEANININKEKFRDHFLNIIDHRAAGTFYGEEEGKKKLNELLNNASFSTEEGIKNFLEKITEALNKNLFGNENKTFPIKQVKGRNIDQKKENLKELYNFVFCIDSYLEPKYELKLGDKELSLLSPGEKGALLIIFYLILDQSDIPLIIDQPEENLDNESIYRILIHFLNETKKRRQVIIITHNPNLAVVADADQIINVRIDRANNYRFFAKHGSLENKDINKVVTDILEGTLEAFRIRDGKYINRI